MGYFSGYDINTNPGTANSFSTAAFQFITSLLPGSIQYFDQVIKNTVVLRFEKHFKMCLTLNFKQYLKHSIENEAI